MRRVATRLLLAGALMMVGANTAAAQGAPQTALPALTQLSGDATDVVDSSSVAINPNGEGVAAWVERPAWPSRAGTFVAYRGVAGAWSAPERISTPEKDAASVHVTLDAAGTATIAWTETLDYYAQVVHVTNHSAAGYTGVQSFTPPAGGATRLGLDVAPNGDAVLAWTASVRCDLCGARDPGVIWASTRTSGGTFGAPQELSDPASGYRAGLAASIGDRGDVAVGWEEGPTAGLRVRVRVQPAGGSFGPAADLTTAPVANTVPNLVVGPTGITTATWWDAGGMHATRIAADGSVAAAQTLPGTYTDRFSQGPAALDVDGAGRVTAAWVTNDGVWTVTGAAGDELGSGAMLDRYATASGVGPSVAVDRAGGALLAWRSDNALRAAWRPAGETMFRAVGTIRSGAFIATPRVALAGGYALLTGWFGESSSKLSLFGTVGDPASIAPPPVIPPDTTAPTFTVTSAQFIRAKTKGKNKHKAQVRIVVRASEAGRVVATLSRRAPGIRSGASCVAKPKRASAGKRPTTCTRTLTVGTPVKASVPVGSTTLTVGSPKSPGTYRVTVTGTDAAGNAARAASRRFSIR